MTVSIEILSLLVPPMPFLHIVSFHFQSWKHVLETGQTGLAGDTVWIDFVGLVCFQQFGDLPNSNTPMHLTSDRNPFASRLSRAEALLDVAQHVHGDATVKMI